MPITTRCSHCRAPLRLPDTLAGKKAKCPKCGETFLVAAAGDGAAVAAGPGPKGPKPAGPKGAKPTGVSAGAPRSRREAEENDPPTKSKRRKKKKEKEESKVGMILAWSLGGGLGLVFVAIVLAVTMFGFKTPVPTPKVQVAQAPQKQKEPEPPKEPEPEPKAKTPDPKEKKAESAPKLDNPQPPKGAEPTTKTDTPVPPEKTPPVTEPKRPAVPPEKQLPPPLVLKLPPGTRIAIKAEIEGSPPKFKGDYPREVTENLQAALRANGFEASDSGDLVLNVKAKMAPTGLMTQLSPAEKARGVKTYSIEKITATVYLLDKDGILKWRRERGFNASHQNFKTNDPPNEMREQMWRDFEAWSRFEVVTELR